MNTFINTSLGKNQLTPKQILSDPILFLAFGFGAGLAKKAPGTCGTIAAIPVYLLFTQMPFGIYSVLTIFAALIGISLCGIAANKLGEHDFSGIVWDEIVGFLITMWLVACTWQTILVGFILFRFFDIVKPWPIKWIDRQVDGGLGIMLDDVLAGIFALVIMLFIF